MVAALERDPTMRRRCVGCGESFDRAHDDLLMRFVRAPDGSLVCDPARRLPGRGAWCFPAPDCIQRAAKKNRFAASFRAATAWGTPDDLIGTMRLAVLHWLIELAGTAAKAGAARIGVDEIVAAADHSPGLAVANRTFLLVAHDMGAASRRKVLEVAPLAGDDLCEAFDKLSLGKALGAKSAGGEQRQVAAMLVVNAGLAAKLRQANRLRRALDAETAPPCAAPLVGE